MSSSLLDLCQSSVSVDGRDSGRHPFAPSSSPNDATQPKLRFGRPAACDKRAIHILVGRSRQAIGAEKTPLAAVPGVGICQIVLLYCAWEQRSFSLTACLAIISARESHVLFRVPELTHPLQDQETSQKASSYVPDTRTLFGMHNWLYAHRVPSSRRRS